MEMKFPLDRKIRFILIAIIVASFVGFLFPIAIPDFRGGIQWSFLNIVGLAESGPFIAKIYLLWPLVAGILGLVALMNPDPRKRLAMFAAAGFVPWIISSILISDGLSNMGMLGGAGMAASAMVDFMRMFLLGMFLTIGGALASWIRPDVLASRIVTAIGGFFTILTWLVPIDLNIPGSGGSIMPAMLPFEAFNQNALVGFTLLLLVTTFLVVGVLSLMSVRKGTKGLSYAVPIFLLTVAGITVTSVILMGMTIIEVPGEMRGMILFVIFFALLKQGGISISFFLFKCITLEQLLNGAATQNPNDPQAAAKGQDEDGEEPAYQRTGPEIPGVDSAESNAETSGQTGINLNKAEESDSHGAEAEKDPDNDSIG